MSAMKKHLRTSVLALSIGLFSGCATFASINDGCPGVYSGVKYNRAYEDSSNVTWQRDPDQELLLLLDLPLSAAMDTILLPYTAFAKPHKHPAGGSGCKAVTE